MDEEKKDFLPYTSLNLGFSNAENYRKRANKQIFEKYFVRDRHLEKLLDQNIYFLVGEKGTGKTAYSTYLSNTKYKGAVSFAFDVRQTEYQKFIDLKRLGYLPLSQYSEVWRVLFLIILASCVIKESSTPAFLQRFTKLNALKKEIDKFYQEAFSPEIAKILNFISQSERSSEASAAYKGLGLSHSSSGKEVISDSNTKFQTNLLTLRRDFESALDSLKLDQDYIVFIDGIDVRPADIYYNDYFDCVRGIIEATWSVNNDFLSDIKDSKGRMKIVLLVRQDIFLRAGLHNVNTKIRDNSVFLNWRTTYKDHRESNLFSVADRILSSQNDKSLRDGFAWDHYFPFDSGNLKYTDGISTSSKTSFLSFLRFSYYRPRDINAMMSIMQEIVSRKGIVDTISGADFDDHTFRDAHADYLLGEIRDQLLFYYSKEDYDKFIRFFSYLHGKKKFNYDQYCSAFREFVHEQRNEKGELPQFFESAEVFLQFIYELNVICFIEKDVEDETGESFIRWCFRERTPSNLAPKVKLHVEYEIFYGLTKALNVGRPIRAKVSAVSREIGSVISVNYEKKFGFIRGGAEHRDYYFQMKESKPGYRPKVGDRVSYEPAVKYGKLRALSVEKS